jgi:hypothetical protein
MPTSITAVRARRALRAGITLAAGLALGTPLPAARAQERLVGVRTATVGFFLETYRFGNGLQQASGTSGASSVVTSATQWVVPVSLAVPLGARWSVDAATTVTSGQVRFAPARTGEPERTTALSGVGDLRVRVTGRLVGDALLVTFGVNAPTGTQELTAPQVEALGVLAAPALGSALPAASAGPSATTGLVYAVERGGWSWAAGAALEVRRRFAPVAALIAGQPVPEFDPGPAVHFSLGGDGFVGEGALGVAVTADVYTRDRLTTGGDVPASAGAVRLGPTLGAELRWRAPSRRFHELTVYAAGRYRAPFMRDGAPVPGTSAGYASAGASAAYPLGGATDLTTSLEMWAHTGMTADRTLVTAATRSGTLGVGLARRVGALTVQPYVRARVGLVDTRAGSANVTGGAAGVTLAARF